MSVQRGWRPDKKQNEKKTSVRSQQKHDWGPESEALHVPIIAGLLQIKWFQTGSNCCEESWFHPNASRFVALRYRRCSCSFTEPQTSPSCYRLFSFIFQLFVLFSRVTSMFHHRPNVAFGTDHRRKLMVLLLLLSSSTDPSLFLLWQNQYRDGLFLYLFHLGLQLTIIYHNWLVSQLCFELVDLDKKKWIFF